MPSGFGRSAERPTAQDTLDGADAPFTDIANGMPGLEPRLPLMFDAMVSGGRLGAEAFARLTAQVPADLYGLPGKGRIAPGYDADLVLLDRDLSVRATIVGGQVVYQN